MRKLKAAKKIELHNGPFMGKLQIRNVNNMKQNILN